MFENTLNQSPKFRRKNWVELYDDAAITNADASNVNIKKSSKDYAPFTYCISQMNDNQVNHAEYLGVVKPIVVHTLGVSKHFVLKNST